MYGHKFVQQQFYNIMRCAFCGDFLKYSAGYQCSDCKYTCHKKCYEKVVTKCISKSNQDMDPEEEKLNHRIPHRFEPMTNIGANWCCHCGYMLPIGKKGSKKCTGKLGNHMNLPNDKLTICRMSPHMPCPMRTFGSRFLWDAYGCCKYDINTDKKYENEAARGGARAARRSNTERAMAKAAINTPYLCRTFTAWPTNVTFGT